MLWTFSTKTRCLQTSMYIVFPMFTAKPTYLNLHSFHRSHHTSENPGSLKIWQLAELLHQFWRIFLHSPHVNLQGTDHDHHLLPKTAHQIHTCLREIPLTKWTPNYRIILFTKRPLQEKSRHTFVCCRGFFQINLCTVGTMDRGGDQRLGL